MTIKEFEEKIKTIRENNPELNVNELEIAPLFNNGMLMMTTDIYVVENGAWVSNKNNGEKAIAIEWMT